MSAEDRLLMFRHGTLPYQPSARVLLQAAERAIVEQRESAKVRVARAQAKASGAKASTQGREQKSAWLPQHIRFATSASELLKAALKGCKDASRSKNVETLYLYRSPEILQEAVELALTKERAESGGNANPGAGSGQADWLGNSNR